MSIVLVTGTSSGIGLAAAVAFARAGDIVIATLRDPERGSALRDRAARDGVTLDVRALDVTVAASVDACVAGVLRDHGAIDVLVNNAGAGHLGSLEEISDAALQRTLETNFIGVWRVTRAVLPAMRAAGRGRILTVTSVGGVVGQPFNDAYCAAKFAVEGAMEALAPVARSFGVHVALIEPGPVNTEFVASVLARTDTVGTDPGYAALRERYFAAARARFATAGQTADEVAAVILEAARAERPHLRYATSDGARAFMAMKAADPTGDLVVERMSALLA